MFVQYFSFQTKFGTISLLLCSQRWECFVFASTFKNRFGHKNGTRNSQIKRRTFDGTGDNQMEVNGDKMRCQTVRWTGDRSHFVRQAITKVKRDYSEKHKHKSVFG